MLKEAIQSCVFELTIFPVSHYCAIVWKNIIQQDALLLHGFLWSVLSCGIFLYGCASCSEDSVPPIEFKPIAGQIAGILTAGGSEDDKIHLRFADPFWSVSGDSLSVSSPGAIWRKAASGSWECECPLGLDRRFLAEVFTFGDFVEIMVSVRAGATDSATIPASEAAGVVEDFSVICSFAAEPNGIFSQAKAAQSWMRRAEGWREIESNKLKKPGEFFSVAKETQAPPPWFLAPDTTVSAAIVATSENGKNSLALVSEASEGIGIETTGAGRRFIYIANAEPNPMGELFAHVRIYYLQADRDSLWARVRADFPAYK